MMMIYVEFTQPRWEKKSVYKKGLYEVNEVGYMIVAPVEKLKAPWRKFKYYMYSFLWLRWS